jgi:hypothetical protein
MFFQVTSHPLLWTALKMAGREGGVQIQAQLGRPTMSFLWDHRVQGRTVIPGTAIFEMAVAAGKVPSLGLSCGIEVGWVHHALKIHPMREIAWESTCFRAS